LSARHRSAAAVVLAAALAGLPSARAAAEAGDWKRGEAVYSRCLACHALARDRVGPRHCGLLGRRAGSVPGFAYSKAMRDSGIVWDEAALDHFLENPMAAVPGTTMGYAGVKDAGERHDLIAWLRHAGRTKALCP
jgi:cytochrome c